MQAYVNIVIKPGTLIQDALMLFESLEKCTILDVDMTTVSNRFKCNIRQIKLFFLKYLFKPAYMDKYAKDIELVLSRFDFVDYDLTEFATKFDDEEAKNENVIDLIEHIVSKALTKVQNDYNKSLMTKKDKQ